MDQHDFAGNVAGLFEVVGTAAAHVDDGHVLHGSERGGPRDGNASHAKVEFGNLRKLWIKSGSRGADGHLRRALGPGMRDGECLPCGRCRLQPP